MSGFILSLTLCLLWANGGNARSGAVILRDALERDPVSLNDMFREVEELMEDTQHLLEEAVDQVCVIFLIHKIIGFIIQVGQISSKWQVYLFS